MKPLALSSDLSLPVDIAAQTIGLVGIRGSGKTNTAGVIAEELLDRHQPVVVLDPTDAWFGLRTGYPIVIFGGNHADLPLSEQDGKVLAEFVVSEQVPMICSLRHLRKNAQRRFVTEFCEELYHLKGKAEYRSPLTVIIDEAPLFIPQRVLGEVARTVGAVEDLIARGRNAGFGVVLISQRPATINKDVLSQADTIIAHRLTSPQDRKALMEWIEENATISEIKSVMESLAKLRNGEAWVWAPALEICQRVQIRMRRTFDSSSSPKLGQDVKAPKSFEQIDLQKIKAKLGATVERAKQDDPVVLRRQIVDLKNELNRQKAEPARPQITDEQMRHLDRLITEAREAANEHRQLAEAIETAAHHLQSVVEEQRNPAPNSKDQYFYSISFNSKTRKEKRIDEDLVPPSNPMFTIRDMQTSSSPVIDAGQQRILDTIAEIERRGIEPTRECVARWMAIHPNGGRYTSNLAALRSQGFLSGMRLTQLGAQQANNARFIHGVSGVLDVLKDGSHRRVFETIAEAGMGLTREQLAGMLGIHPNGGRYTSTLAWLRTMGVITVSGPIELTDGAKR